MKLLTRLNQDISKDGNEYNKKFATLINDFEVFSSKDNFPKKYNVVIIAGVLVGRFFDYLEAKEENHKEEIEHKAYKKYMLMLEENNLSSINIVTKKENEETSNITIKKNK